MERVTNTATLRAFGKANNLEFCTVHKYYTGNAYKDSKGEYLKSYYYYNGLVFKLQYVDGCFNPFLVSVPIKDFGLIFFEDSVKIEQVVEVRTEKTRQYYIEKFGNRFSMV